MQLVLCSVHVVLVQLEQILYTMDIKIINFEVFANLLIADLIDFSNGCSKAHILFIAVLQYAVL
jgi:hypothetical protein